jgi:hypothetical protein
MAQPVYCTSEKMGGGLTSSKRSVMLPKAVSFGAVTIIEAKKREASSRLGMKITNL